MSTAETTTAELLREIRGWYHIFGHVRDDYALRLLDLCEQQAARIEALEENDLRFYQDRYFSAVSEIERLRGRLADATAEGRREWIPVEERLPAREGIYLVAAAGQVYRCYFGIPVSNPWSLEMRFYMSSVSHWQPLPDAPGTHAERGEVEG